MPKTRHAARGTAICLASVALLWSAPAKTTADDDRSMILLQEIQMRYATLGTYADHGTIDISMRIGDEYTSRSIEFVTTFDAPNQLRYDQWYTTPGGEDHEIVLWLEDGEAKIWRTQNVYTDEPVVVEMEARDEAFLDAARGSGGMDNPVPRFLLARGGSSLVFVIESIRTEGELEMDGVECLFLSGKFVNGSRLRLVVGKEDLLIRRIEFIVNPEMHIINRKLGEGQRGGVLKGGMLQSARVKTTITYSPRTDQYFLPEDLIFDPETEGTQPIDEVAFSSSR